MGNFEKLKCSANFWIFELSTLFLNKVISSFGIDFGCFFFNKVISSFGINFRFVDFSLNFGYIYIFIIWTTMFDNSVLKLLLYGPRFRINQSYPGNIGNLSLQHSPESWKYYPNPEPNPKPNLYPFLDPGRLIPGKAVWTRTRAASGILKPKPTGGATPPPRPPSFFFGTGGVQRHIFLASYFINPHPASYFINIIFINVVDSGRLMAIWQEI